LQWFMPSTMTPIWSKDEPAVLRYERRLGRDKPPMFFEPDEVVYIWIPGQHETKPKTSPVEAGMNAAGVLFNVDEFAKQFFERGAIKPFIIGVPATTQKKDRDEVESFFNRFFTGMQSAFRAKAINADVMNVQQIGEGLESLANNNLTESLREDIATAMGVPHSLVLSNAASYATAEIDEHGFYDRTILPECRRIQNALNKQLFRPEGLRLVFKPQEMPLYQEDEAQRSASLLHYVQAGVPLSVAVQILGVDLPADVEPEMLVERPLYSSEQGGGVPEPQEREAAQFRRWASRRLNSKHFDPAQFESDVLTDADKAAIVAELREDAKSADAPFPVTAWADYP
jgi:hypothetical protein